MKGDKTVKGYLKACRTKQQELEQLIKSGSFDAVGLANAEKEEAFFRGLYMGALSAQAAICKRMPEHKRPSKASAS